MPLRFAPILIAVIALSLLQASASAESFQVMFRDGQQLAGETMHFWHGGQETRLDDRPLFEEDNPPRVIRRTGAAVRLTGPFVEFRNGDLLPGLATRYLKASSGDADDVLAVTLPESSPLVAVASGEVRVRADQVRVIVRGDRRRLMRYTPGAVLFHDGRRVDCRAIRIGSSGLLLLTEQGLLEATLGELSEIHLPGREWNVTETQLRWLRWAESNMLLESLVLTNGARITIPQGMTEMETHYRSERFAFCAVHPAWSLETLYFDPEHTAVSVYRRLNEIPLSLLPTTTVRQQATLHHWPWRRDHNLRGDLLASGPLTISEGFGVHGNTTLAIELPSGAASFSGWAGLDRSVGRHGAMRCAIRRETADGDLLWQSELLKGGEPAQPFGPLDVRDCGQLLLMADEAADAAAGGADPFDIGDDLCWLLTTVTLAPEAGESIDLANNSLGHWIPELEGWTVSSDSAQVQLRPVWSDDDDRWRYALGFRDGENESGRIRLVRQMNVTLANAYLPIAAATLDRHASHEISFWVNAVRVPSTMNGDVKTNRRAREFDRRVYILNDHAGKTIDLVMRIEKADRRPSGTGVYFSSAQAQPLVTGLPSSGEPHAPDVPLNELTPATSTVYGEAWQPRVDGGVSDRTPLNIRGYPLKNGICTPDGVELTYTLRPEWSRFVALIGMADGWKGVGPYEIHFDGEQRWISTDPDVFARNDQGQQIDIAIPPGSKTITLKMGGRETWGAWAEAGFIE